MTNKWVIDKNKLVMFLIKYHEEREKKPISRIKLQKALYFLFAYYGGNISLLNLGSEEAETKSPYLFEADFEAWTYGPVDRDVYFNFKNERYGAQVKIFDAEGFLNEIDDYTRGFVADMTERIFNTSDFGLVNLSHNDQCWKTNFDRYNPQASNKINNDEIIKEYEEKELN